MKTYIFEETESPFKNSKNTLGMIRNIYLIMYFKREFNAVNSTISRNRVLGDC